MFSRPPSSIPKLEMRSKFQLRPHDAISRSGSRHFGDIFSEGNSYHHFLISHDGWIPMGLGQFPVATGPWSGVSTQVAIGLAVYLVSQLHRPLGPSVWVRKQLQSILLRL